MRQSLESRGGLLGYHGLLDWWDQTFTKEDQKHIESRYSGTGICTLTRGELKGSSLSAPLFLKGLSGYMRSSDKDLALRILYKAEHIAEREGSALDRHFVYGSLIERLYRANCVPETLEKVIGYCWKQIDNAEDAAQEFRASKPRFDLPSHHGYYRLSVILRRQKKADELERIKAKAISEGWSNWRGES